MIETRRYHVYKALKHAVITYTKHLWLKHAVITYTKSIEDGRS